MAAVDVAAVVGGEANCKLLLPYLLKVGGGGGGMNPESSFIDRLQSLPQTKGERETAAIMKLEDGKNSIGIPF